MFTDVNALAMILYTGNSGCGSTAEMTVRCGEEVPEYCAEWMVCGSTVSRTFWE